MKSIMQPPHDSSVSRDFWPLCYQHFLSDSVLCIAVFLTVMFVGVSDVSAQPQDESKESVPETFEELSPENQQRYKEAISRLRELEREQAEARLQAERDNPTYGLAVKLEKEASEEAPKAYSKLWEIVHANSKPGDEREQHFQEIAACAQKQGMIARLREMVESDQERQIVIENLRGLIKQQILHPEYSSGYARQVLPKSIDGLTDDQATSLYFDVVENESLFPHKKDGTIGKTKCSDIQHSSPLDSEVAAIANRFGRYDGIIELCRLYIEANEPKFPDKLKKFAPVLTELFSIFSKLASLRREGGTSKNNRQPA